MRSYDYVDSDTHLEVSPDNWRPFVDKEYRQYAPTVVKIENGGDAWLMPGAKDPVPLGLNFSAGRGWENLRVTGVSYDEHLVGAGDALQRLEEMDQDGMDAAILFPAVQGSRTLDSGVVPREAYSGITRGYNDWLSDFCSADTERLLGGALLPRNIDDAIDEYRRIAELPGIRTAVLHMWPNGGPGPDPEDDRFWAVVQELGFPLCSHGFFGGGVMGDRRPLPPGVMTGANAVPINMMLNRSVNVAYTAIQLITEGVFDRFPGVQFYFAETGIGWVPFWAEAADDNYKRHKFWAELDLEHDPSYYVKNHYSWSFQIDTYGIKLRHDIGVGNIMWASDFPHVSTDWPNSIQLVKENFSGIPEDETHAIVAGNAIKYFKLDEG